MPRSLSANKPLRRPNQEQKPEVKAGYRRMPDAQTVYVDFQVSDYPN